ncbi:MAG: host attachment protein [Sandaracinaceae bacterium]
MSTLVVATQKAVARVFRHAGAGEPLEEIETLEHPASSAKNRDLVTDSPGAVRERKGPQVRAMRPEQTAKEREAANFAREVAAYLRAARLSGDYHRAVVIAAPAFLGLLRDALGEADRSFIEDEIAKNVATHDQDAIERQLDGVLTIGRGEGSARTFRR